MTEAFGKRWCLAVLLLAGLLAGGRAWAADGLQTPFTIWMMNNESRLLSILSIDRRIMDSMSMGNGMLIAPRPPWPRPENRFYRLHLQYFALLNEVNQVFQLAQRFGSGQMAKTISSVQPGEWATLGFRGLPASRGRAIAPFLNDFCRQAYVNVLGLEEGRDSDLVGRLQGAVNKLTDSERRLLSQYFGNFLALYPKNATTRTLLAFLKTGLKKDLSKGVAAIFSAKPATTQDESAGLLMELEQTATTLGTGSLDPGAVSPEAPPDATGSGTAAAPASDTAAASGPEVDPFNIWEGGPEKPVEEPPAEAPPAEKEAGD